jgi:hypothetical protein
MWSRTSRRLLSGAIALAAGVAAGWWQWSHDDAPSDEERIAALDGVASVEYDHPAQHVVTLDAGATTVQISEVLSESMTVLETSADPPVEPRLFLSTETAEYYIDLEGDADQMAAVIASTEAADLVGADVEFDADSRSQFTYRTSDTVLAGALGLVSAYDRAGVADLRSIGVVLEFWYLKSARDLYGPTIELDTSRTDVALRRLDLLAKTLQRSGADLTRADLGAGDQVIEVAVPARSKAEPTAQVFTAAYGESHLDLTIDSGPT